MIQNLWIYILVALISLAILANFLKPNKPIRDRTVIVGPSGAGKTSLFLELSGKSHPTVTTQIVSSADTNWGVVIDTPGHPKLESLALAEINNQCKRVIFMVDGTNLKDIGPLLYRVLLECEKQAVPVLVAGNKYDLFSTVSIRKVKQVLEQEIGEIRESKDKGLGENDEWLGLEGPFKFEDLGIDIQFESGSVKAKRLDSWA